MKKKDYILMFSLFIIGILISSLVSVAATGNLFDSNEVTYDNSSSGMSSSNVKDAMDELYAAATNYSDIDSRLTNVEKYFTHFPSNQGVSFTEPTSRFDNAGIDINVNGPDGSHGWISFYANGVISAPTANIDSTTSQTKISAYNGSGGYATLKLEGSSIVNKDNKEIRPITCVTNQLKNVPITTKSASGAYYSQSQTMSNIPTGSTIISVSINNWSQAIASFSVYGNFNNYQIGFMSDVSETVGIIDYRVCYI